MKHKDWSLDAAREINGLFGDGHADDRQQIVGIIRKHHEGITKPEPGHIWDWAAKAGAYLHAEGLRL